MYESFFGLKERPFSIAPDPRYLFMSQRHKEALAHLAYGIRQGAGFVLLTGEVGTGKTTICRQILRKLPAHTRLAFILNPMLNAKELLATLCDELGIDYPEVNYSLKQLTDNLTRFLLQCHEDKINVVLMIDEAQNLAIDVLEQIRLLTNLETDQRKLLQIILVGQPELQHLLARNELRQLAQRVTARYHLRPLNKDETKIYILHRVRIAGSQRSIFSKQALRAVYQLSDGVPRLINNICDRALMAAFGEEQKQVSEKLVKVAGKEVLPELEDLPSGNSKHRFFAWIEQPWAFGVALILVLTIGVIVGQANWFGTPSQTPPVLQSESESVREPSKLKRLVGNNASVESELSNPKQISESSKGDRPQSTKVDASGWRSRSELFAQIFTVGELDPEGLYARQRLASRWQINYDSQRDGKFCRFILDFRMKCNTGFDKWQTVIDLNRPVNLFLEDGNGKSSWLTLHKVEQFKAEVETKNGKRWIELDWLLAIWSRQYQIIWQAPPAYQKPIKLGDKSEQVTWLSTRLAFIFDDESLKKNQVFDEYIQDLLIDFQQRHNLDADGIAGMQTLIQLNTSTVENIPRLN